MEKKKIMIVDDNKEFLHELTETLEHSGYDVIGFTDGSADIPEKIRDMKPDVLLLDLKLKGKSGFQLADEISSDEELKQLPIIAMTGHFTKKEHELLMETCGIHDILRKPFNPLDIIARIETAVKEEGEGE